METTTAASNEDANGLTPAMDSDGTMGMETTMAASNKDANGSTMAADDPLGRNSTGISRHRRYLKTSADDPR